MHRGNIPDGRDKPCLHCGTTFWCTPCRDVGGTLPEKKYCSSECYRAHAFPATRDELLWAKITKGKPNECWLYTGALDHNGYGRPAVKGKRYLAHRRIYELEHGAIPDGLHVLHKCDTRRCCNPKHLFAGTHQDNMADKVRKGRIHDALLTADQVRVVRVLLSENKLTQKEIGAMFGVKHGVVCDINKGYTYRHVE